MNDEFGELYEKILDGQDWEMDDLDRLVELAKAEGYDCGRLAAKEKAIELVGNDAYAITFQTMGQYRSALIQEIRKL